MRTWVKRAIRTRLTRLVRNEVQQTMTVIFPQLIEFQQSPREERQSYHDHTGDPLGNAGVFASLKDRLREIDVPVEDVDIDIADFQRWLKAFPEIERFYELWRDVFVEKCLQHYLAFRHLQISRNDVYIDIGGADSPWASVLRQRGIKAYRLDLAYHRGIHGINIGADAGDTGLPNGFASVLSVHDAFENFIGEDADIRFVREAARVLDTRGRYGILPLYLDTTYFVTVSPYCDLRGIPIDHEAKRLWRDDRYAEVPFSRHYSPEAFKRRVFSNIPQSMAGKVLYFRNLVDLTKHYREQRFMSFFMLTCENRSSSG